MPRIRTIKPEFWTDKKTGNLSNDAKCLLIGLLNYADDYGVLRYEPEELKIKLFPYHSHTTPIALVEWLCKELMPPGLVEAFTLMKIEGQARDYIFIRNFNKHQRIDKPSSPVLPDWKTGMIPSIYADKQGLKYIKATPRMVLEGARTTLGILDEDSTTEGKGGERKGKEKEKENTNPSSEPQSLPKSTKGGRKLKTKKGLVQDEDLINEMQNCYESLGLNHQKEFYDNAMTLRTDGKPCPAEGSEYATKLLCDYFKDFYRKSDWHKAVLSGSNKSLGGSV